MTRGKPPKRSAPPTRKTPLARSRKPITRGPVKKGKRVKRFAGKRDAEYAAWIRRQPCLVTGCRTGEWPHWNAPHIIVRDWLTAVTVEACHVRSRGAGGDDHGNLVPLASFLHREQHAIGIRSFSAKYGLDLQADAARLWARYTEETDG